MIKRVTSKFNFRILSKMLLARSKTLKRLVLKLSYNKFIFLFFSTIFFSSLFIKNKKKSTAISSS